MADHLLSLNRRSSDPARGRTSGRVSAQVLRVIVAAAFALALLAAPGVRADTGIRPGRLPTASAGIFWDRSSRPSMLPRTVSGSPWTLALPFRGAECLYRRRRTRAGSSSSVGDMVSAVALRRWDCLACHLVVPFHRCRDGADYGRVIMLVYGLDHAESVFGTYASAGGSAHFLVGANATILASDRARIVLISSGLVAFFGGFQPPSHRARRR